MPLSPVVRAPLSLTIAQQLREAILDGTLAPHEELPTEAEMTRTFGVSRPTVREALRVLQSQGLVTGADTVSTARPRVSPDRTSGTAALALSTAMRLGAVPLDDLVALRVVLEAEAMREVRTVPPESRECLAVMADAAAATDVEAFHVADVEFHVRLSYAGGNRAIGLVIEVLRESIAGYLLTALQRLPEPAPVLARLCAEHEAIVAALDDGQPELAAERVVAHVRGFYGEGRA
jgi:GntR family transcriptional regulator, transcriptional repressor for pyruvate dehydrogenase complex